MTDKYCLGPEQDAKLVLEVLWTENVGKCITIT